MNRVYLKNTPHRPRQLPDESIDKLHKRLREKVNHLDLAKLKVNEMIEMGHSHSLKPTVRIWICGKGTEGWIETKGLFNQYQTIRTSRTPSEENGSISC